MRDVNWQADLTSGFLVFLIALPLCLGISMASGFPPIGGLITAIVGGLLTGFLGGSRLTIKGPAAGLIVIAIGAVTELGGGDMALGYKRTLAVGFVAALVQIALALTRAGKLGELMPSAVVHGMLSAIGVIIIAKQAHVAVGVTPAASEPLHLLAEIPHSLARLNPEVAMIGLISLLLLFGLPMMHWRWVKAVPGPMLVLAAAVPLATYFDLSHEHHYQLLAHDYVVGPNYLINLPGSLLGAITHPDFSVLSSATSIKYIVMFALVGTIESLLTVTAVDSLDPERRSSDLSKDLLATGVGNAVAAAIGGLPMISEVVRSKANIDNSAKSHFANFFHGLFLLLSLALIPGVLHMIPLAALAAMLIYTGVRLASPSELRHAYAIGPEQLLLFMTTMVVTLATDLLVGVGLGLLLKLLLHIKNGAPLRSLFKTIVRERRDGGELTLEIQDAAIFTNYLGLKKRLLAVPPEVTRVVIDFRNCWIVDHTVLGKLHHISASSSGREIVLRGLDGHQPMSSHTLAARRKPRPAAA